MRPFFFALATIALSAPAHAQDLLGYWPGDGSVADASGLGGDGVPVGDVSYSPGMRGDAFSLDSGEWVEGPLTPVDLGSFAITGWWNLDPETSHGAMFEAVNTSGHQPMRGHLTVSTHRPLFHMSACGDLVAPDGLELGRWYHLGMVYDGVDRVIYVDGVEVARDTCAGITTPDIAGYRIGTHAFLYFVDGLIDEVRLYGDALSAEQVAEQAADPNFDAGPELFVGGSCPGDATVDVTGLTEGGRVQWLIGDAVGEDVVSDGDCVGASSGLTAPRTGLVMTDHDGDGILGFTPRLPSGACSRFLQAIDLDTCRTSQVFDMSSL